MAPKIGTGSYVDYRDKSENGGTSVGPFEDSSIISPARWHRNECVSTPATGGEKTIEVKIWHHEKLEAAKIARDYAEYALAEAFGDEYAVDVTYEDASLDSLPQEETSSAFFGYVDSLPEDEKAKDCNVFIQEYVHGRGGGDTATVAVYGDRRKGVEQLAGDCVRPFGNGEQDHYRMNVVLHEIGHCLGFSHEGGDDDGEVVEVDGKNFATPMKTTYANTENVIHRFSNTCREKGPEVQ
jgi:hypothetical protein